MLDQALVSAEAEVDHAHFVPLGTKDVVTVGPRSGERSERGQLPTVESEHAAAVRRVLGMSGETWTACPLPGHHGMASVGDGERYRIVDHELRFQQVLWCDCLGSELYDGLRATHWYSLADAYLAVQAGKMLRRGFRSRYRLAWWLLFDVDLGLIEPALVRLPEHSNLSVTAHRTADLFRRVYAAQQGVGWPEPGLLSVGLVREWLQCPQGRAWAAIHELLDAGVLVRDGKVGRAFRYRPGGMVVPIRGGER